MRIEPLSSQARRLGNEEIRGENLVLMLKPLLEHHVRALEVVLVNLAVAKQLRHLRFEQVDIESLDILAKFSKSHLAQQSLVFC
jgi:hypothetical protein